MFRLLESPTKRPIDDNNMNHQHSTIPVIKLPGVVAALVQKGKRMTILYIENHGRFADIVTAQFLASHEVERIPTIAGARELLNRREYEILIVDYDLDDGKGAEIVSEVASRKKRPRMIAASSRDEGNEHMMSCGADATCSKMDFDEIEEVISQVVARSNAGDAEPQD